ncbi:hypothetical protein GE09DRAFT_366325 [Coniochaeta sp. 2T2.1]|nr:hypothetical protein GE09DRAFT_366325 [Coniochaeta sp. 2T2.1]
MKACDENLVVSLPRVLILLDLQVFADGLWNRYVVVSCRILGHWCWNHARGFVHAPVSVDEARSRLWVVRRRQGERRDDDEIRWAMCRSLSLQAVVLRSSVQAGFKGGRVHLMCPPPSACQCFLAVLFRGDIVGSLVYHESPVVVVVLCAVLGRSHRQTSRAEREGEVKVEPANAWCACLGLRSPDRIHKLVYWVHPFETAREDDGDLPDDRHCGYVLRLLAELADRGRKTSEPEGVKEGPELESVGGGR